MTYEDLLMECDAIGITAKEKPLKYNNGRQKGKRIAIRNERYRHKYGELRICVDNYVIIFEPSLQVLELI